MQITCSLGSNAAIPLKNERAATDLDEASAALTFFDSQRDAYLWTNNRRLDYCRVADFVGSLDQLPFEGNLRLCSYWSPTHLFLLTQHDGPPEKLFQAIRATRRALRKEPKNPRAHLLLGEAYFRMLRRTGERAYVENLPLQGRTRTVQAIAAFTAAIRLQPDLFDAHAQLASLYQGLGYKDLELKQLQALIAISRGKGAKGGAEEEFIRGRLERVAKERQNELKRLQEIFAVKSAALKVADRANLAVQLGLAGMALEILLASDIAAFGVAGLDLELRLLLETGAMAAVREWMVPEHKDMLGSFKYHWYRAQTRAASGDYPAADEELAELEGAQRQKGSKPGQLAIHRASTKVARAIIALETGRAKHAHALIGDAIALWQNPDAVPYLSAPDTQAARGLAQCYLDLLPLFAKR